MRVYRIRVDGREYEMDIALIGEAVCMEPESDILVGERLTYNLTNEKSAQQDQPEKTR